MLFFPQIDIIARKGMNPLTIMCLSVEKRNVVEVNQSGLSA
jgi:hypothetical protein